ncbi:hypothetical protein KEU06_15525 [Pseudaminobacter sp. 19-2017]|uniref:Uncharacterized protein n=1 Tax=Pseudaminobacter soli (ex Zhang et al. 2022) TaxID=2831468 RepID=A0A942DZ22_9HYPH|nr:hypothetical protein [Pseudaminobacter soli]MBS3650023.1 hypothetical protein [Pseudaminobacter soli]
MTDNHIYTPFDDQPIWLTHMTKAQAADFLGIHINNLTKMTDKGIIPPPVTYKGRSYYSCEEMQASSDKIAADLKNELEEKLRIIRTRTKPASITSVRQIVLKAHGYKCDKCGQKHNEPSVRSESGKTAYLQIHWPDYLRPLITAKKLPYGWDSSINMVEDVGLFCTSCAPYTRAPRKESAKVEPAVEVNQPQKEFCEEFEAEEVTAITVDIPHIEELPVTIDDKELLADHGYGELIEKIQEQEAVLPDANRSFKDKYGLGIRQEAIIRTWMRDLRMTEEQAVRKFRSENS